MGRKAPQPSPNELMENYHKGLAPMPARTITKPPPPPAPPPPKK